MRLTGTEKEIHKYYAQYASTRRPNSGRDSRTSQIMLLLAANTSRLRKHPCGGGQQLYAAAAVVRTLQSQPPISTPSPHSSPNGPYSLAEATPPWLVPSVFPWLCVCRTASQRWGCLHPEPQWAPLLPGWQAAAVGCYHCCCCLPVWAAVLPWYLCNKHVHEACGCCALALCCTKIWARRITHEL